jgi:small subunit ribosomal protein S8
MSQDIVADSLNAIMNAKRAGKKSVELKRHSRFLVSILALAKLKGYIKDYKLENNILRVEILKLNKCKAVKPRYTIKASTIEKYEKRYLPAKEFGILVVSTSKGLVTNKTAKEKNMGGSLVAYMY